MINNKTIFKVFFTFLLFLSVNSNAQNSQQFDNQILNIKNSLNILKNITTENEINLMEKHIDSLFIDILASENTFIYDFSDLKQNCSVLFSDDKQMRIITWNIYFNSTGEYKYFGYIQYFNKKDKKFFFYKLNDKSATISNPENAILDDKKWFGCIYYDLVTQKVRKKTYYTLLGWDGNSLMTNRKIIEVLSFQNNKPKFGYDFEINNKSIKRIIFEYNKQVNMSLLWNKTKKMIIWDHLSPSESKFEGLYQYYGPDFTYNGLIFKKKEWQFVENVDVTNE